MTKTTRFVLFPTFYLLAFISWATSVFLGDLRAEQVSVEKLLPGTGEIKGWSKESTKTFSVQKLYEYKDGGAEDYFSFGFRKMVVAEYEPTRAAGGDVEEAITVDICDMSRLNNAFGFYAERRYDGVEYVKIGAQGHVDQSSLLFFKGIYYVEINPSDDTPKLKTAVLELGKKIAVKIPGKAVMPAAIEIFPKVGIIPNSIEYRLKDAMAQSFLKNTFIAHYNFTVEEQEDTRILFAEYSHETEAKDAYARYSDFIKKYGKLTSESEAIGDESFAGRDKYHGGLLICRSGKYILGGVGVSRKPQVKETLQQIINSISKQ